MKSMILLIAVMVCFVWLGVLSFFLYRTKSHYDNLIATTRKEKLSDMLDELLQEDKRFSKEVKEVRDRIDSILEESRFYFNSVKVIRFNPFEKRGREQSFVIAFLDREKNGIVINFMYTPEGLRVFTKKVMDGKGQEYELSDEEKKAIHS